MSWLRAAGCAGVIGCWILSVGRAAEPASASAVSRPTAAEPPLVMVQSGPGRFEIAAADASLAHALSSLADEAWRHLAAPLGLPDAFPTPVYVRVLADESVAGLAPFRVTVEEGGIVSLRVVSKVALGPGGRHALVRALLLRLAAAHHGAGARLTSPWWLEHACLGWWRTRAEPAQLDALKQASMGLSAPRIDELLNWRESETESRARSIGATWLLTFLQSETGASDGWPAFRQRLLGGEEPMAALRAAYPGSFEAAAERELWWQTGYHHLRRQRSLPALEAAESRERLETLTRFVFAHPAGDGDIVLSIRDVIARRREPLVAAELARRSTELQKWLVVLHPFYRNAGLSLADVFAAKISDPRKHEALCATFEQDWRDAMELELATKQALDRMER